MFNHQEQAALVSLFVHALGGGGCLAYSKTAESIVLGRRNYMYRYIQGVKDYLVIRPSSEEFSLQSDSTRVSFIDGSPLMSPMYF